MASFRSRFQGSKLERQISSLPQVPSYHLWVGFHQPKGARIQGAGCKLHSHQDQVNMMQRVEAKEASNRQIQWSFQHPDALQMGSGVKSQGRFVGVYPQNFTKTSQLNITLLSILDFIISEVRILTTLICMLNKNQHGQKLHQKWYYDVTGHYSSHSTLLLSLSRVSEGNGEQEFPLLDKCQPYSPHPIVPMFFPVLEIEHGQVGTQEMEVSAKQHAEKTL